MTFKTGITIITIIILLVALLYILPLIIMPLYYFVLVVLAGGITIGAAYGLIVLMVAFEKYLSTRADRHAKQYQARVISTEHGTWFVAHKHIDIAPLSNTPYLRINGHERELTVDERFYSMLQAPHSRVSDAVPMVIEQKTTLTDLIDKYPHIWLYGGTGDGKTTLLRWIAYRRQAQGHDVVILDSKEHPAKWTGFIRRRTQEEITTAIQAAFTVYNLNSEALSTGQAIESEFRQISIISDEWTSIIRQSDLARQFTDEMTREARKTGLHLVIATQTNLAADIGLDGRYKVVNGFLQLELIQKNGEYIARAKRANVPLGEFALPEPIPTPPMLPAGYDAPGLETVQPEVAEVRLCPVCKTNPLSGKQVYCGDACRQKAHRNRVTDVT